MRCSRTPPPTFESHSCSREERKRRWSRSTTLWIIQDYTYTHTHTHMWMCTCIRARIVKSQIERRSDSAARFYRAWSRGSGVLCATYGRSWIIVITDVIRETCLPNVELYFRRTTTNKWGKDRITGVCLCHEKKHTPLRDSFVCCFIVSGDKRKDRISNVLRRSRSGWQLGAARLRDGSAGREDFTREGRAAYRRCHAASRGRSRWVFFFFFHLFLFYFSFFAPFGNSDVFSPCINVKCNFT